LSADSPVVLVVGAASRDVVPDDPRGWRLGGAVMYASLALARLGLRVWAVVGADREAAAAEELDLLRDAGAAVAIVELESGPVFDNDRHLYLAASDQVPMTALPRRWTSGFDALLIAPVAAEVGDDWADLAGADPAGTGPARTGPTRSSSGQRPVVALGWQGLLRDLEPNALITPKPPIASPITRAADLVVVSEADVAIGTRPETLHDLLRPTTTLVWTEGEAGGQVVSRAVAGGAVGAARYPAIPAERVVDATGAGDVFLAAMLAGRLLPSRGDPVTVAAAAASLTVEGPGLAGVPDLADVLRRMTRPPSLASRRPSAVSNRDNGRPSQA
jgi:sugar/nucleoside kinase (ribokinase family)